MSAPAASSDLIPLPYADRFISNDGTCTPREYANLGRLLGTSNGSSDVQARWNCCWIETSLHALLADPFLQHFVRCFVLSPHVVEENIRQKTRIASFKRGRLLMKILAYRLKSLSDNSNTDQWSWDNTQEEFMKQLRAQYPHLSNPLRYGNMGDPDELLPIALADIRTYIYFTWNCERLVSTYPKLFLCYGHRIVLFTQTACSHCGEETSGFSMPGGVPVPSIAHLEAIRDRQTMMPIIPSEHEPNLQTLVVQSLNRKWEPVGKTCSKCQTPAMSESSRLVNLPWMLYIPISRANGNKNVLSYDPEELIIGPTIDDQKARYRLLGRIMHQPGHYTIDMRIEAQFKNWNFERVTSVSKNDVSIDYRARFLVWQQIPGGGYKKPYISTNSQN